MDEYEGVRLIGRRMDQYWDQGIEYRDLLIETNDYYTSLGCAFLIWGPLGCVEEQLLPAPRQLAICAPMPRVVFVATLNIPYTHSFLCSAISHQLTSPSPPPYSPSSSFLPSVIT